MISAGEADHQSLNHEYPAHGALVETQGFHDRDVARLLVGNGRNDVVGAEAGHQQNGTDDRVHDHVAYDQGREQVLVRLLPRYRLVARLALDAHRDVARRHGIGGAHAQLVHEAGLPREDLRRAHQNVGSPFVDGANAGVEGADDLRRDARAEARLHRDVGADARPDLLRQPDRRE